MSITSYTVGDISESTHALVSDAWRSWYTEGPEVCILKLDTILKNSANLS